MSMERLKPVDMVILGGGWTGLLLATEVTKRTSLSVLVLERGAPALRPSGFAARMDELDYNVLRRMMQNIADETITHRHSKTDRAVPVRQYGSFHPGAVLGGAREHWGGVSNRFLPEQFIFSSHLRQEYGSDRLPENIACSGGWVSRQR